MELYLYKIQDKIVVTKIENVLSYTDNEVIAEDGVVYSPLADDVELSSLPDCSETLRSDWRIKNPSQEQRMEELEDLISVAMKQASDKASKEMESKMKAATGGLNIPGLNF